MQQHSPAGFAAAQQSLRLGALCWRQTAQGLAVLLVTTRSRNRWIIPKGRPVANLTAAETAAREAWEEAGVLGRINAEPLGMALRPRGGAGAAPETLQVHALAVEEVLNDFPEAGLRLRLWLPPDAAAARLEAPDLARLIAHFRPS